MSHACGRGFPSPILPSKERVASDSSTIPPLGFQNQSEAFNYPPFQRRENVGRPSSQSRFSLPPSFSLWKKTNKKKTFLGLTTRR